MDGSQPEFATLGNTLTASILEISRELRVRDVVYPKLVVSGKLSQNEADRRRKALRCALYYLETIAADRATPPPANTQ